MPAFTIRPIEDGLADLLATSRRRGTLPAGIDDEDGSRVFVDREDPPRSVAVLDRASSRGAGEPAR